MPGAAAAAGGALRLYCATRLHLARSGTPLILASIIAATLLSGVASVLAAAWLSFGLMSRLVPRMVSLSAGILLGAFAVSELNVRGQPFFSSLSDFIFLNDGAFREAPDRGVPPFSEARYRSVIGRFREQTHHYVEQQAVWWLAAWGEAAVPSLVGEVRTRSDYDRTCGAIRALGEIGDEELSSYASRVRPGRTALRFFDQVEWDA